MKVTVFTDYACPFCYIGHRTLAEILENKGNGVEVEYVFMEIHPEVPQTGIETGKIVSGPLDRFNAHILRTAEECGIKPQLGERISNSKKAIILRAFMENCYPERVKELDELIYSAYLIDNKDIGDDKVLAEILSEMGMDESIDAALKHTMANIKFEMDRSKAMAHYVYEIPSYHMDGKHICGAVTKKELTAFLGLEE